MALINCSECNKQISDTALKCIACGSPIEKKDSNVTNLKKKTSWKKLFSIITLVVVILSVFFVLINKETQTITNDSKIKDLEQQLMEEYSKELYDWISATDNTFAEREPFEEWSIKVGEDDEYVQELYLWISSVDNTFAEREPFEEWAQKVKKIEFKAPIVEIIDSIEPEDFKIYLSDVLIIKKTVNQKAYDSNGNFLGLFDKEGLRKGNWKGFYANNVLAYEGPYNNGLMNGYFKHYYRNGILKHEGMYKNGTKKNINNKSGVPQEGREGLHIFYYTNGAVKSKTVHTNSHYNGLSQSWHKNGVKQDESVYRNGNLVREQVWDINGECIKKN